MTEPAVLTEVRDRVLIITLNRPEARNAVNTALAEGLTAAVDRLDADDSLTLAVLTGAGKGFSAGMDLKAFASEGPPTGFADFMRHGAEKPLIAAVEGFAVAGGLEIALVCDLIVAADDVKFGIPEVNVGLFAGGGAMVRLPQRVPFGVAMEMALTADPIPAADAHRYGLVSRLAPGQALEAALELAALVARNAPLAVKMSKKLLRAQHGMTDAEYWEFQGPHTEAVFGSEDAKEGPRAFAEKRAPNWTGR